MKGLANRSQFNYDEVVSIDKIILAPDWFHTILGHSYDYWIKVMTSEKIKKIKTF